MQAVIIAGGLGTRLRPLTITCPKPLIPIVGKPILQYQIELIKKIGISDIILCLNYKKDLIEDYFKERKKIGVKLNYCIEEVPLGTGGAVKNAEEYLKSEEFFVFNGDVLTDMNLEDLLKFHKKKKSMVTITLTPVEDPTPYGLVLMDKDNRVTQFLEKPSPQQVVTNTINAGIYIISRDVLKNIPEGKVYSLERELYPKLLNQGVPIYGYVSSNYWLDIGTPKKYLQAHQDILQEKVKVEIEGEKTKAGLWGGKNCKIDSTAKLSGYVYLGNNLTIGKDTELSGFTVIGNNCSIGNKVKINDSIILNNCSIGDKLQINRCIIGKNCQIKKDVFISDGSIIGEGCIITSGVGKV